MLKRSAYILTVALIFMSYPFAPARAAQHSIGSNIVSPDGTIFTITQENNQIVRRPYTSAGTFLSYSFNSWASVKGATVEDLVLPVGTFVAPREGSIFCSDRGSDYGTCYLISNGKKVGFISAEVFNRQGHSFSKAIYGDISWLPQSGVITEGGAAHLPGTIVILDRTFYLVASDADMVGISDMSTLASWGYSIKDAVATNKSDRIRYNVSLGTLRTRQPSQIEYYSNANVVDGSKNYLPEISSLSQTSGESGAEVTITGKNFNFFSNITLDLADIKGVWISDGQNSAHLSTKVINDGLLVVVIPSTTCPGAEQPTCSSNFQRTINPGVYSLYVRNSTGVSKSVPFTVVNSSQAPSLSSAYPTSATPGTQITLYGSNFDTSGVNYNTIQISQKTCVIPTGDQTCTPFSVAVNVFTPMSTQLTFTLPITLINPYAPPGVYYITVTTQKGVSNQISFTILATP